MITENGETEFERRTRAVLEAGVEELSGHVRSRLTQARHAALDQMRVAQRAPAWQRWVPAGAAASVVLLALIFTGGHLGTQTPMAVAAVASPIDDLELLADSEAYELTQDQQPGSSPASDFDFYEWAAGESTASNGGTAGT
jgi:negative regulator of sigma E activity